MVAMEFQTVVSALARARATSSRIAKAAALAECLRSCEPDEVALVAHYLSGRLPQRRTGVGWASLSSMPPPAPDPSLDVADVDRAMESLGRLAGPGSATARTGVLEEVASRATQDEQDLLRGLLLGDVRAGVKEGSLIEAIGQAFDVPLPQVRRAVMLSGSAPVVATWCAQGRDLAGLSLVVGRPAHPMLAGSAPDLSAALEQTSLPCFVDAKLDGIRIQVHRRGEEVQVWSRTLDDLTGRHPEIEYAVRHLPVDEVILDGEALVVDADGRPRPFQETNSRGEGLRPFFFDILHLDGEDLIDHPLAARHDALVSVVPEQLRADRLLVTTEAQATVFQRDVLARGHEGVVVKSLDAPWQAGRRGSGWVKVKPRHTVDLVVLAVEWGSGRRRGLLSNIHLGARSGEDFVMVGKTFKGMTDSMLAWQTERFLALQTHREGHVVHVSPEQVVEIAFDGVQRSSRYPGGVALRFARVVRYRDDKTPEGADTIGTLRALLPD